MKINIGNQFFFKTKLIISLTLAVLLLINLNGCLTATFTKMLIEDEVKFDRNANNDPEWEKYIGKKYKLLEDLIIYKLKYENTTYIGRYVRKSSRDGVQTPYSIYITIKKGTVFQISDIFVRSSHFYGDLVDLNGNLKIITTIISLKDSHGTMFSAEEYFLFERVCNLEGKKVILKPKSDLIAEISDE